MKQSLINLSTPEHVLFLGFILIGLGLAGLALWLVIFLTIRIRKMGKRSRQLRAKKSQ